MSRDILGKADIGGYCATAKIEMLMESRIERHTEELASLAGARMVRTSEPDEGARWNEAMLKLITGRDTVSARRLYEKQFTFRPEFKLVVNGNFRPAFKSTGEEIFRRMHFVEFPESIPESERIKIFQNFLKKNGRGFCNGRLKAVLSGKDRPTAARIGQSGNNGLSWRRRYTWPMDRGLLHGRAIIKSRRKRCVPFI